MLPSPHGEAAGPQGTSGRKERLRVFQHPACPFPSAKPCRSPFLEPPAIPLLPSAALPASLLVLPTPMAVLSQSEPGSPFRPLLSPWLLSTRGAGSAGHIPGLPSLPGRNNPLAPLGFCSGSHRGLWTHSFRPRSPFWLICLQRIGDHEKPFSHSYSAQGSLGAPMVPSELNLQT